MLVFVMEIIKINGDKVDAIKCDPETKENCNEKESAYIDKMKKKFAGNVDGIKGELKRLEGMSSAKVKPELQQWMSRRCAPPPAPCCGRRLLCLTRESGRGRKKILSQLADKEL